MSNPARVTSTKLIASVTSGTRKVNVAYVDKTDAWTRALLGQEVQKHFLETTETYLSTLRPDTDTVALQETPHSSERDQRTHFTAVEMNKDKTVTAKRHFVCGPMENH